MMHEWKKLPYESSYVLSLYIANGNDYALSSILTILLIWPKYFFHIVILNVVAALSISPLRLSPEKFFLSIMSVL